MRTPIRNKKLMSLAMVLVPVMGITSSVSAYIEAGYVWSDNFPTVSQWINTSYYFKPNVRTVQKIVATYPPTATYDNDDGWFGADTTYRVEIFQWYRGLISDGVVGPDTWESMQYRLEYDFTDEAGNDYYEFDTEYSDYGEGTTGYCYMRHLTNGNWQYRVYGGGFVSLVQ